MKTLSLMDALKVVSILILSSCDASSVAEVETGSGDRAAVLVPGDGGAHAVPGDTSANGAAPGVACAAASDCGSGFCVDGVCCDTACTDSCRSCALSSRPGVCSPVIGAQDPGTCEGEMACGATGACAKVLGRGCATGGDCASGFCVDGVCCEQDACGACQACNIAGSEGGCAPVARLTDDPNSNCGGTMTCNGLGVCKQKNGRPCAGQVACASGFCADGLCCDLGCRKQCFSCAAPGTEGTCLPLVGQDDLDAEVTCTGASQTCDVAGTGSCKLKDGALCSKNEECAFGFCRTYHKDADGDGYGNPSMPLSRCDAAPNAPAGYVAVGTDCCDSDPDVHPGQSAYFAQSSACGYDYNCNGRSEPDHATCGMGTITLPVPPCGKTCTIATLPGHPYFLYTQACR